VAIVDPARDRFENQFADLAPPPGGGEGGVVAPLSGRGRGRGGRAGRGRGGGGGAAPVAESIPTSLGTIANIALTAARAKWWELYTGKIGPIEDERPLIAIRPVPPEGLKADDAALLEVFVIISVGNANKFFELQNHGGVTQADIIRQSGGILHLCTRQVENKAPILHAVGLHDCSILSPMNGTIPGVIFVNPHTNETDRDGRNKLWSPIRPFSVGMGAKASDHVDAALSVAEAVWEALDRHLFRLKIKAPKK
jgi:hypothetical protein